MKTSTTFLSAAIASMALTLTHPAVIAGKAPSTVTYQSWTTAEFDGTGTPSSQTVATADPDHDGISNLMEYAIGSDPLFSDPEAQPRLKWKNGTLSFSFTQDTAKSDIKYEVQFSSDLQQWSPIPSEIVSTKGSYHVRSATMPEGTRMGFVKLVVALE